MLRKIVDLFVFSSLYIALCAALMVWQTSHLLLGASPSLHLIAFVFFSTMCSYNFHWYLTPQSVVSSRRVSWTQHHKRLHAALYVIGGIGAGISFLSMTDHLLALCVGAFFTFLYSAPKVPLKPFRQLKDIAIGKTIYLALVWTYVTAALPVLVATSHWTAGSTLWVVGRFSLIYAICILFDYRDRADDKADGIRSLITLLDERGIDYLFAACLILFAVCTIALTHWHYPALYIMLLLSPGIILAAVYRRSKTNFSDDLYYIVLDGLMAFSGLLMLIVRI